MKKNEKGGESNKKQEKARKSKDKIERETGLQRIVLLFWFLSPFL